jgi:hypothetical protein
LGDARKSLRTLRRLKGMAAAEAFTDVLHAGLSALEGDRGATLSCLRSAAAGFDALKMQLFAASAWRRVAELDDGDERTQRMQVVDARMRELGVVAPARWAAMYVPDCAGAQPASGEASAQ